MAVTRFHSISLEALGLIGLLGDKLAFVTIPLDLPSPAISDGHELCDSLCQMHVARTHNIDAKEDGTGREAQGLNYT